MSEIEIKAAEWLEYKVLRLRRLHQEARINTALTRLNGLRLRVRDGQRASKWEIARLKTSVKSMSSKLGDFVKQERKMLGIAANRTMLDKLGQTLREQREVTKRFRVVGAECSNAIQTSTPITILSAVCKFEEMHKLCLEKQLIDDKVTILTAEATFPVSFPSSTLF